MTAVKAVRWICQSCSAYCSSSHFVSGTQLCVGVLIVSLFAWFRYDVGSWKRHLSIISPEPPGQYHGRDSAWQAPWLLSETC